MENSANAIAKICFVSAISIVSFMTSAHAESENECKDLRYSRIDKSVFLTSNYASRVAINARKNSKFVWLLENGNCYVVSRKKFRIGNSINILINNIVESGIPGNTFVSIQVIRIFSGNPATKLYLYRNRKNVIWKRNVYKIVGFDNKSHANLISKFNKYHRKDTKLSVSEFETEFKSNTWHSDVKGNKLSTYDNDQREFWVTKKVPSDKRVFIRNYHIGFIATETMSKVTGVPFYIGTKRKLRSFTLRISSPAHEDYLGTYNFELVK